MFEVWGGTLAILFNSCYLWRQIYSAGVHVRSAKRQREAASHYFCRVYVRAEANG